MSRSGYTEELDDQWAMIKWRGQVASAIRGKRGQAFLRELLEALDAMPEKRLVADVLEAGGEVCAIGSLGVKRGVDMSTLDPHNPNTVAAVFNIAPPLAMEVVYENDEAAWCEETPEARWVRMRSWVAAQIKGDA